MYKIYSYCSYKQSPAGFQIGCTDVSDQDKIHLHTSGMNEFIQKSFELGIIKNVYGKIPYSDNYVYMIKKLKYCSESEDDFAAIIHMNFAFEFENYKEYKKFKNGINKYETDELSSLFHTIIVPDTSEEIFALLLNGHCLTNAIKKIMKQEEKGSAAKINEKQTTHFILKSKKTGIINIREAYGDILDAESSLSKNGEYEIILK